MSTSCYMDVDLVGKYVDQTKFIGLIGFLLSRTTSKLKIMFDAWMCARFQTNLKESYITTAKKILKYIKGTNIVSL